MIKGLPLVSIENIEYLQVTKVTKGDLRQISEEGKVKKSKIQGRIKYFDDAF